MTDQQHPPDWGDEAHSELVVLFEEAVRDVEPTDSLQARLVAMGSPGAGHSAGASRFALAGAAVLVVLGAWTVLTQYGRGGTDSLSTDVDGVRPVARSERFLPDPRQWVGVGPVATSGSTGSGPVADVWVFTLDGGNLLILLSSAASGDRLPALVDAEIVEEPHRSVVSWADKDRELRLVGLGTSGAMLRSAADDLIETPQGWMLRGAELTASEAAGDDRPRGTGVQTDYHGVGDDGNIDVDAAIVHIESPGSVGDLYRTLASASSLGEVSTVMLDGEPVYVIADGQEPYALALRDGYLSVWQAPSAGSEVDITRFVSSLDVVDTAARESATSQHTDTAPTSTSRAVAAESDEQDEPSGRGVQLVRTQVVGENGATTRVALDFDRPLPGNDVTYVSDLSLVNSPIRALYSTQRSSEVSVCDGTHLLGATTIGTIDVVLPASWFADREDADTGPFERVGDPAKVIACGPHRGFYQYSIWGPPSADPLDVDVTISPDRLQLTIDIAPASDTGTSSSWPSAVEGEGSRDCAGLVRSVDASRRRIGELDAAISRLTAADNAEGVEAQLEELRSERLARVVLAQEARGAADALDC